MNLDNTLNKHLAAIENRLSDVELSSMGLFGERLRKISELSPEKLREWDKYKRVSDIKRDTDKIEEWQAAAYTLNKREINELFDDLTYEVHETGKAISEHKTTRLSPLTEYRQAVNPQLRGVLKNYQTMSLSAATNDNYKNTIRHYVHRLTMDDSELNAPTAIRKAIREMGEKGINTVTFRSGRTMRLDSAVRNSLMTEYGEIVNQVVHKLADEIDAQYFEISVEQASADDHIMAQGRIFSADELEKLNNFEVATDIDGVSVQLGGEREIGTGQWNCRHGLFPFIPGISERNYSQEDIERINKRNEKGAVFDGKKYSLYELTQLQRQNEVEQRRTRGTLEIVRQVAGTDPSFRHDKVVLNSRIKELRAEYARLGNVLEPFAIRSKTERTYNIAARAFR